MPSDLSKLRSLVLAGFWLAIKVAIAQGEGNNWYFGQHAGLDFNSGVPLPLLNGNTDTWEGTAVISDPNGNLLFYTDGQRVWNRIHQIMPNGSGLMGGSSSSQSALIVRQPGSASLYYIFTTMDSGGIVGLRYSVVDLALSGGNGDVTAMKNIPLITTISEKVTAIRHANGEDYWVIVRKYHSTLYHAFLLTNGGIQPGMVNSDVGVEIHGGGYVGYMKPNPMGTRIASANAYQYGLEVFDFDNSTGTLSNPMIFTGFSTAGVYGVEFSADGNVLYASEHGGGMCKLYQYNLLAGDQAAIEASRFTVGSVSSNGGALQIGPDGRIYHAVYWQDHLGVVNNPSQVGAACNYVQNGLSLGGAQSYAGLPNILVPPSIMPSITASVDCFGDSTLLSLVPPGMADAVTWNFGDPASGAFNTSTLLDPAHLFADTGSFTITAFILINGGMDTATTIVTVHPIPLIDLGNDTTLCASDLLVLDATTADATYLWQDGSTDPTFTASVPGTYQVTVTLLGCTANDQIELEVIPLPNVELGNDTTICQDSLWVIEASRPGASYLWQDGSTGSFFPLSTSGEYWLSVTAQGCSASDTLLVFIVDCSAPVIELPNVFSPNGDGENDSFIPLNHHGDPILRTTIWNRWGQVVYTTSGPPDWDGLTDGRDLLPEGIYYWVLELDAGISAITPLSGVVTLLR